MPKFKEWAFLIAIYTGFTTNYTIDQKLKYFYFDI